MKKLAKMYSNGISVKKDAELSVRWQQRLVQRRKEIYDESQSMQDAAELLNCLYDLGEALEDMRKYRDCLDIYQ